MTAPVSRPARRTRLAQAVGLALAGGLVGVGLAALTTTPTGVPTAMGPGAILAVPAGLAALLLMVRWPAAALLTVVFALPVASVEVPETPLRVIDIAALVVVFAAAARVVWHPRSVNDLSPWLLPALGLVLAAVLSIPRAHQLGLAAGQSASLAFGVGIAVAAGLLVRGWASAWRLVSALLGVAAGIALHALSTVESMGTAFGGSVVTGRIEGIFAEPNELASFTAAMCMLGLGAALAARAVWARAALLVAVGVFGTALLMSLSRGGWVGGLLGLVALVVLLPASARRAWPAVLPVIGLVLVLGLVEADTTQVEVIQRRASTLLAGERSPYDNRGAIWQEGLRQFTERPLTGQGAANFPVASETRVSEARTVRAVHAHNVPLTVAAEVGLAGLAALLALTGGAAVAVGRRVRRLHAAGAQSQAALVVGLAAALTTFVGHGLVDFTLRNPALSAVVWLLTGLLLAAVRLPVPVTGPGRARPSPRAADV